MNPDPARSRYGNSTPASDSCQDCGG